MTAPSGPSFDAVETSFGGTRALHRASLRVGWGEIVALLGENGTGTSTLIETLGGLRQPDAGRVSVDDLPDRHVPGSPRHGQAAAVTHQDLGLIDWISVAETIAMGVGSPRRMGAIDWWATGGQARAALALVEADSPPTARVGRLSRTETSLVAIARALAVDCDVLALDEWTASLPADEVERLFAALRRLRAKGVGMI